MPEKKEQFITVVMKRETLGDFPHHVLPAPYAVRWYVPGDERVWTEIQRKADLHNPIGPEVFRCWFGDDADELGRRQCYLLDGEGGEIGTATGWVNDEHHDSRYGRVHWVALVPEAQGKGLGKPLLTIVLDRMRQLGHERAFLTTESVRTVAIRMYLELGFEPEIQDDAQREEWTRIRRRVEESYS